MRRSNTVQVAILASVVPVATAQWWGGAPECAQTCLSSAWSAYYTTATTKPTTTVIDGTTSTITPGPWTDNNYWPAQSDYCDGDTNTRASDISKCFVSACTSTLSTLVSSYSAMSASLCSRYDECKSAGSTGEVVHTITYPGGGPVSWGAPGGWGAGGGHGGWGNSGPFFGGWKRKDRREAAAYGPRGGGWGGDNSYWSSVSSWTGSVVTVTGCANDHFFAGSPWFVGPGCGWNQAGGFDGWVGWGSGWSWGPTSTVTVAVTTTETDSQGSQNVVTTTGLATVAMAVSGDYTTASTINGDAVVVETSAPSVGGASGSAFAGLAGGPGGSEGSVVTRMCAVAACAVVLLAGVL